MEEKKRNYSFYLKPSRVSQIDKFKKEQNIKSRGEVLEFILTLIFDKKDILKSVLSYAKFKRWLKTGAFETAFTEIEKEIDRLGK